MTDDTHDHAADDEARPGKGRPTPKRKDQEKANRRSIVSDNKAERKEAGKERRAKAREQREKEYQAMRSGDESKMPIEHRGPERRFIRDYIDARTSMGEFMMPLAITFVLLSFFWQSAGPIGAILVLVFYILVAAVVIELFVGLRRVKKNFIKKFGEARLPRGWTFYAISRSLNLRRLRTPKPKVKRGEFPV